MGRTVTLSIFLSGDDDDDDEMLLSYYVLVCIARVLHLQ